MSFRLPDEAQSSAFAERRTHSFRLPGPPDRIPWQRTYTTQTFVRNRHYRKGRRARGDTGYQIFHEPTPAYVRDVLPTHTDK